MERGTVIGIDGGGTYTRIVAASLTGEVLAFTKTTGSHPGKNASPEENVKAAIMETLKKCNQSLPSVTCMVGGFAGLDEPGDKQWAYNYLNLHGIKGSIIAVNDAVIAQFGAFLGQPGLLAIAGTGSIVLGRTEDNAITRNYDFHQKCEASARFLSYSVIYEIISQKTTRNDQSLLHLVLAYWEVENVNQLRTLASKGFLPNKIRAIQKLSQMSPVVTSEAEKGSKMAHHACEKVVESLVTGIELVASTFMSDQVPLALEGSVIKQPYIMPILLEKLESNNSRKSIYYQSSILSPVLGAVLYAYQELGIKVDKNLIDKLISEEKSSKLLS